MISLQHFATGRNSNSLQPIPPPFGSIRFQGLFGPKQDTMCTGVPSQSGQVLDRCYAVTDMAKRIDKKLRAYTSE